MISPAESNYKACGSYTSSKLQVTGDLVLPGVTNDDRCSFVVINSECARVEVSKEISNVDPGGQAEVVNGLRLLATKTAGYSSDGIGEISDRAHVIKGA